jgi:hypothetical protein
MKKIITVLLLLFLSASCLFASTTDTFNSGSADGSITATGSGYSGWTINTPETTITRHYVNKTTDIVRNTFLIFDTSSIPDTATITSARIKLASTYTDKGDSGRNINCEYYEYTTLSTSDFALEAGTTAFTAALSDYNAAGTYYALSNLTSISKTGNTGVRISVSGGNPAPFSYYFGISYSEEGTYCQLEVTYNTGYQHKINGVIPVKVNGVVPIKINGL